MIERQAIVTVAVKGRCTSKPRPWLVIQNDAFAFTDSITLCIITHGVIEGAPMLRIDVDPSAENGLQVASQVQIEKIVTVLRSDIDKRIGRLEDATMAKVDTALRYFLAL